MAIRKILTRILLIFNGMSAIFWGVVLIIAPNGEILHMPLSLLANSPFANFLIPGIILFTVLGLGSLITFAIMLLKKTWYSWPVIAIGCANIIWIITQIIIVHGTSFLQNLYLSVGGALLILGIWELKVRKA